MYSHFVIHSTNYLSSTPRYTASILELNLIYINHYLIYNLPKRKYYFGIKVFNCLLTYIKDWSYNIKLFKLTL